MTVANKNPKPRLKTKKKTGLTVPPPMPPILKFGILLPYLD